MNKQELDLERNVYTAYTDAKCMQKKVIEAAEITLEAREVVF